MSYNNFTINPNTQNLKYKRIFGIEMERMIKGKGLGHDKEISFKSKFVAVHFDFIKIYDCITFKYKYFKRSH